MARRRGGGPSPTAVAAAPRFAPRPAAEGRRSLWRGCLFRRRPPCDAPSFILNPPSPRSLTHTTSSPTTQSSRQNRPHTTEPAPRKRKHEERTPTPVLPTEKKKAPRSSECLSRIMKAEVRGRDTRASDGAEVAIRRARASRGPNTRGIVARASRFSRKRRHPFFGDDDQGGATASSERPPPPTPALRCGSPTRPARRPPALTRPGRPAVDGARATQTWRGRRSTRHTTKKGGGALPPLLSALPCAPAGVRRK